MTQSHVTYDTKPYGTAVAILFAIGTVVGGIVTSSSELFPGMRTILIGTALMALPSALYGYFLPRMRAGITAAIWGVPKTTFLLSRPLLRLAGSSLVGNFVGMALLAIIVDTAYWLVLLGFSPTCYLFFLSAYRRLKRHPNSEFAMPLPYPNWRRTGR